MRKFKGISPVIASVLLVAFAMAVGAVLVVWITGFTQQQTSSVGQRGERQTLCAYSTLTINRDDVAVVANTTNVTVTYSSGTETLNITGIRVRDSTGQFYINISSANIDSNVRNWDVGRSGKLENYLLSGRISGVWKEITVTALCQNQVLVTGSITSL